MVAYQRLKQLVEDSIIDGITFDANAKIPTIIAQKEELREVIGFLQKSKDCYFRQLIDITAVDYPGREKRFELIYNLLSFEYNERILLKISVADGESVASVTNLYKNAGWYEREVWDMYGIGFDGNSDLRRILTDYNFSGHPLRKDFPLSGYTQVKYDENLGVIYEPINLEQPYRNFDYLSPWEGMMDNNDNKN